MWERVSIFFRTIITGERPLSYQEKLEWHRNNPPKNPEPDFSDWVFRFKHACGNHFEEAPELCPECGDYGDDYPFKKVVMRALYQRRWVWFNDSWSLPPFFGVTPTSWEEKVPPA